MTNHFTASGKQILRDGQHFADCATNDIAWALAEILNCKRSHRAIWLTPPDLDFVERIIWP